MTKTELIRVFKGNLKRIEDIITSPTYVSLDYYAKMDLVLDHILIMLKHIEQDDEEQNTP